MPFTPTISDSADLGEIRTAIDEAASHIRELRSLPAERRPDDFADQMRSAVDFINTMDPVESVLDRRQRQALEQAAWDQAVADAERGGSRGPRSFGAERDEYRTAGHEITDADGYSEWAARGGRSGNGMPFVHEVRNLLSSVAADGGVFRPVGTPELYPGAVQRRQFRLRDVLDVRQTGLASVPYIREVDALTYEGGASAVAEASAKPEVTMEFVQVDAPARKIAAWLPATDEILMDAPTLRGYIDGRLAYMIQIREEAEILDGDGSAPHLEGINEVTGTQTQSTPTGDYPAIIGRSIGKVENVDGEADGVATNPLDYWLAVTSRYSTHFDNSGNGGAPSVASGVTWGLPAVRTRALAAGSAIVGAWRLGATLFDRQQTTIKVGDQHSDLFIKNQVVILAEERVAFAIHRPALFVKTTVPAGS